MKFCTRCGTQNEDGNAVCTSCGTPFAVYTGAPTMQVNPYRSEERRVGKECRL